MKPSKIIWAIAALALAGLALNWVDTRSLKRILRDREVRAEAKIQELEKANAGLYADNAEKDGRIALATTVIAGLRADVDRERAAKEAAVEKLRTAPPAELLVETRRILKTDEVTFDAKRARAEYTVPAFRIQTEVNVEWESLKFTLVPKIEAEGAWKDRKIADLSGEVSNFKAIDAARQEQTEAIRGVVGDLKEYIRIRERKGLVDTLLKVGGGILVGYALGR